MPPIGAAGVRLMVLGSSSKAATPPAKNPTANQGRMCTQNIVFSAASVVFFEVSPIHMPNQVEATRAKTMPAMAASVMAPAKRCRAGMLTPPGTATVVGTGVVTVVTSVMFVVTTALVGMGAGVAGTAAVI